MEELIKKLQDAGKEDALQSEEALKAAMKELGYSDKEIDSTVSEIDSLLDDDALEEVTGGMVLPVFLKTLHKQSTGKKPKAKHAISTDTMDIKNIKC